MFMLQFKSGASEAINTKSAAVIDDQIEDYLDQIEELAHKLSIAESKLKAGQAAASHVSTKQSFQYNFKFNFNCIMGDFQTRPSLDVACS